MAMYRNHRQPPKAWTAWLDGWTLDMQARGMSGQTVESYWYRLTSLAIDCATPPNKVTAEQIQAWIVQTPDATTRAGRRGAVNEFYKWAVRMRRVRRNPVDRVPPVRRPKRLAKQPAPEQAVARGLYSPDWKARLMVMLAAEVGLRRGEINLVRGADVVEQDTPGGQSVFALIVHGKGAKSRLVPISCKLADEIRNRAGDGWLFPGRYGGHCSVDHVERVIKRATGMPPHSLRRRFGRLAYQVSDHDLRAVQALLGHESPTTTQTYIYVPSGDLQAIAGRVVEHRPGDTDVESKPQT